MTNEVVPHVNSVSVLEKRIISCTHEFVVKNYSLDPERMQYSASVGGGATLIVFLNRKRSDYLSVHCILKAEIIVCSTQSGKGGGVQLFDNLIPPDDGYNKKILEAEYLEEDCLRIRVTIGVIKHHHDNMASLTNFGSALKKSFGF